MSKELTALETANQLKEFVLKYTKNGLDRRFVIGSFDIIEAALKENLGLRNSIDRIQKVFEIIKNKRVDAAIFYEPNSSGRHRIPLTKEEYELLKEILK